MYDKQAIADACPIFIAVHLHWRISANDTPFIADIPRRDILMILLTVGNLAMLLLFVLTLTVAGPETKAICPGTTTPEVNACQKSKFDQADADLNRYYKAALGRLQKYSEPKVVQRLVQAQRAWISYRDAECGAVFDKWGGGTIRASMEFNCQTRLTQLRTYSIWKNWLTFVDGAPPILPRPAMESAISDR